MYKLDTFEKYQGNLTRDQTKQIFFFLLVIEKNLSFIKLFLCLGLCAHEQYPADQDTAGENIPGTNL